MLKKKVIESMILDRIEWRKQIHVAEPDYFGEDPIADPKIFGTKACCCWSLV
jgi:hypothetical protein